MSAEQMHTPLKPCPFCGGDELMLFCDPDEGRDNSGPSRRIQCAGCNIEAPFYPTYAEAIAAWNRRADAASSQERIAQLEAQVAEAVKVIGPFAKYTPDAVFESKARFVLTETTETGGGWFGAEDFRAARDFLAAPERIVGAAK